MEAERSKPHREATVSRAFDHGRIKRRQTYSTNPALPGSYNFLQVTVSVLIAISASYVALFLAERLIAAQGRLRRPWLGGGAAVVGIGIWSMHFNGTLPSSCQCRRPFTGRQFWRCWQWPFSPPRQHFF
jgi:Bacterial signalling protein N terminal repeat